MTVGECIERLKKFNKNANIYLVDSSDWSGYDIPVDMSPEMIHKVGKRLKKKSSAFSLIDENSVVIE